MHIPNHTIETIKSKLNRARVMVIGDVMLDRYWFGSVNRISPEAPVPIAKISKTEARPGGAANVARNISSLWGDVNLISVIGADEAGRDLENILKEDGVNTHLTLDNDYSTTVKLRVLAQNQQLIRVDFEEEPSHEILLQTFDVYKKLLPNTSAVILSDYGKGGLVHTRQMIEEANKAGIKILVDPKGSDYARYKNATLITPNKKELELVVGMWKSEEELHKKAFALKKELNLKYLLLTRSEEGMTLFLEDTFVNYPALTQEVYDVSGAGDTVIATLGLMLANGIPIEEAVFLANVAAGVVVGKVGTATLSREELLAKLTQYTVVS